jgi:excisionase family DNA binding protein
MSEEQFNKLYAALTGLASVQAKEVLNIEDVELLTGLAKSTIYRLCWAQKLPYYKDPQGRTLHFKKSEIEGWMLHHRTPTAAELAEQARAHCVSNPR